MDSFLSRLSANANAQMAVVKPVAITDADAIWKIIQTSNPEIWEIRDQEQYNKSFFSYDALPNKRSLSYAVDLTAYEQHVMKQRPARVDEPTFIRHYQVELLQALLKPIEKIKDKFAFKIKSDVINKTIVHTLVITYTFDAPVI